MPLAVALTVVHVVRGESEKFSDSVQCIICELGSVAVVLYHASLVSRMYDFYNTINIAACAEPVEVAVSVARIACGGSVLPHWHHVMSEVPPRCMLSKSCTAGRRVHV